MNKAIREVKEIIDNHMAFDSKGLAKKIDEYYSATFNEYVGKVLNKLEQDLKLVEHHTIAEEIWRINTSKQEAREAWKKISG